jgi:hypothetical protein
VKLAADAPARAHPGLKNLQAQIAQALFHIPFSVNLDLNGVPFYAWFDLQCFPDHKLDTNP